MLSGWKTVLFGLFVAIAPAALEYLKGIDWTQYVSPIYAPMVVGAITIILRFLTTTAIGVKKP